MSARLKRFRRWVTPKRDGERWRRANLLDKLPGMCWSSLVDWSLHRRRLRDCRIDSMCPLLVVAGRRLCVRVGSCRAVEYLMPTCRNCGRTILWGKSLAGAAADPVEITARTKGAPFSLAPKPRSRSGCGI